MVSTKASSSRFTLFPINLGLGSQNVSSLWKIWDFGDFWGVGVSFLTFVPVKIEVRLDGLPMPSMIILASFNGFCVFFMYFLGKEFVDICVLMHDEFLNGKSSK